MIKAMILYSSFYFIRIGWIREKLSPNSGGYLAEIVLSPLKNFLTIQPFSKPTLVGKYEGLPQ
jgi:hypothetical protein